MDEKIAMGKFCGVVDLLGGSVGIAIGDVFIESAVTLRGMG